MKIFLHIIVFIISGLAIAPIAHSQSIDTEFGKNRVQYHDDFYKWWSYETSNFITYWYGKSRNIGQAVLQMAEMDHNEIQSIVDHRINDKLELIVFTDLSDMKQSNIGIDETFVGKSNETTIIGNKIFVYFDGNHNHLRNQVREGIATVYLNAMLSNTSLQDIVKSKINLGLPIWYIQGLVKYISSPWDPVIDDRFRDIWAKDKKYAHFEKLVEDYPSVAGHSFWYYIDQTYSPSAISSLLYMIRINRNVDDSFLFVFGTDFDYLIEEWHQFYTKRYKAEKGVFAKASKKNKLKLSNKKEVPISQFVFSPDGKYLAYIYNKIGKIRVNIRNIKTKEEHTIFKYGYKNNIQETDYNYPIVAWHPKGGELSILYEHHDRIYLRKIDTDSGEFIEQVVPEELQRAYSLSYKNDFDYILSGSASGFSDLFIYQSQGRTFKHLTEDYHDDLDAHYTSYQGKQGILFSSNRESTIIKKEKIDSILPIQNFDLFFLPLDEEKGDLIQLTKTENRNERFPFINNKNQIVFLDDNSGIRNLYVQKEGKSIPLTNKNRNIIQYGVSPADNRIVYSLYMEGEYTNYTEKMDWNSVVIPYVTAWKRDKIAVNDETLGYGVIALPEEQKVQKLTEEFLFRTKYDDPENIELLGEGSDIAGVINDGYYSSENHELEEFVFARAIAARTAFKVEEFGTRLDNEVLFEGLQTFTGTQSGYQNTPVSLLFIAKAKDLFEDYTVQGAVRVPLSFNGTEFFLSADDNKSHLDKRYLLYRKETVNTLPGSLFPSQKEKSTTLLGQVRLKYPFDVYRSIRTTFELRFDKDYLLSSEQVSSNVPDQNGKRISIKGEYVYDNTIEYGLNIRHGTRYKFYVELLNSFQLNTTNGFNFDASTGYTGIAGFDARHYFPFFKHSILALRAAGATSLGSEKMLYYLGGVENWIGSKYDNTTPIPEGKRFAYQTIAANLRGHDQNVRNGSSFLLANAELRVSPMKYIFGKDIRSGFFRNLQLAGFFDIGTAWHGLSPTSSANPINTEVIDQSPQLVINVNFYRDPIVMGYGFGMRSTLLGYFLKFDVAWGIESRTILTPKYYFSMGYDF